MFSPQQLLERLDSSLSVLTTSARDLPPRQRTLRQTIAWSYELLSEAEQRLFARLGVFVDGRSIDAVEAVCGPDPGLDVVDGLESLLSKSLLYQEEGPDGQPRFYMLETIQEYALEKLDAAGELEEVRDRHLHYFLSLGEAMEGGYRRHGQMRLLARTDAELGNIRAAFEWAMATGQLDAAAGLVSSIDYYLEYFGSLTEGYEWVTLLVERLDELSPDRHVRFLRSAAVIDWSNGRLAESAALAEQGWRWHGNWATGRWRAGC